MDRRYQKQYNRYDDKDRCLFYYKVGVCRHGNKCSKTHIPPTRSHTIVLLNLVNFPRDSDSSSSGSNTKQPQMDDKEYESIFEDLYIELAKYGRIQEMYICDNGNDHLRGNVYIRYASEQNAKDAKDELNTRWYDGKPIYCNLTHIYDFNEAICRSPDEKINGCERGNHCNFMHIRRPTRQLQTSLENAQRKKFQLKSNPYITQRS